MTTLTTDNSNSGIHTRALLVWLTISTWSARKYDKQVSLKVNADHNACDDAGRYNKMLLPGDCQSYKHLMALVSTIRVEHYKHTLCWSDEGWRVLPTANYMDYTDWFRNRQSEYDRALDTFVDEYPTLKASAKIRLNGLYREEDYPSPEDIRRRFAISVGYMPLPANGDVRVALDSEQVAAIEASVQAKVTESVGVAMKDAWKRLYDTVSHIATQCGKVDGRIHDSLIENARELCQSLEWLNFANDADLESMRQEVENSLVSYTPDSLRDNPDIKSEAATKANEILAQMRDVYGVSGE